MCVAGAASITEVECACVYMVVGCGGEGVTVCVGVIAWVRKTVCGWGSLDSCHKVCVGREGGESVCECVGVGVTGVIVCG